MSGPIICGRAVRRNRLAALTRTHFVGPADHWISNRRRGVPQPEFPISKCLGANKVPSSTRAIVVSHGCRQPSNQAHKTIRRRELAAVRQRRHLSLRLHSPPTPPGTHLPLGYLSSRLMTSRIIATLVLDGARLYAPTLAGISPGTLPPQEAETPTSWHAAPDVHPS